MMFGHFNKYLILFFSICVFSSCMLFEEEEEIQDVYIDFPVQYEHVIKHIRTLQKNDFLTVKSKSGLSDQLFCNTVNNSKEFCLNDKFGLILTMFGALIYFIMFVFGLPGLLWLALHSDRI